MQHRPVVIVVGVVVVVVGDMDVVVVVVVVVGVVVVVVGVVVVVVGTLSHRQAIGQRIFMRGRIAEDFFCEKVKTSGPLGTVFG